MMNPVLELYHDLSSEYGTITNQDPGEIGGAITHSRFKNIREWADKRIQTMSVLKSQLTSYLSNPNNRMWSVERAFSAPQPGQPDDEPETQQGGGATSSGPSLRRSEKFKNLKHDIHYNLRDSSGYSPVQNPDYPPGTGHDDQSDYGHYYFGGSST
jgi:hypothetical protein